MELQKCKELVDEELRALKERALDTKASAPKGHKALVPCGRQHAAQKCAGGCLRIQNSCWQLCTMCESVGPQVLACMHTTHWHAQLHTPQAL